MATAVTVPPAGAAEKAATVPAAGLAAVHFGLPGLNGSGGDGGDGGNGAPGGGRPSIRLLRCRCDLAKGYRNPGLARIPFAEP